MDQMYIENRNAIIVLSEADSEDLEHTAQSWLPLDLLNNSASTTARLYPSMHRREHEHMN